MKKNNDRKFVFWREKGCGRAAAVLGAALLVLTAGGCGAASKYESATENTASSSMSAAEAWDGGIYDSAAAMEEGAYEAEAAENVQDQSRKLIKTVNMSVETEEFDLLIQNVEDRVTQLGGYVEESNIYNGSYTSDYRSRSASITARIPAQNLEQFITDVAAQSNVTRKSESVEDVTLQYVDLESHKNALLVEQETLLSMLEQAESIEDIIAINEQLTDVRYRIESMESQLRTYDNKIDYSTVYLNVEEVEYYAPYVPKSTSERISEGFVTNLYKVGNGIANFFIELIIALPIIVTLAVIVAVLVLILYALIKSSEKRAAKRREKRMAENPGQYNRYGMRMPSDARAGRGGARTQRGGNPAGAGQNNAGASGTRQAEQSAAAQDQGYIGGPADVNPNTRDPFDKK